MATSEDRQRRYYTKTADDYEGAHVTAGDADFVALEYVAALLQLARAKTVLDVGAGTGRAVRLLASRGFEAEGVEPVAALREQAVEAGLRVIEGDAIALPCSDGSYDAVVATGLLHHVAQPAQAVREMIRVASKAVFISDSNRFGQGSSTKRALKFAVHRVGAWSAFTYIRTKGKGYMESEGDGVFYSYSIWDSISLLQTWADRVFVIPTAEPLRNVPFRPVTEAPTGLLVAIREPADAWAGQD